MLCAIENEQAVFDVVDDCDDIALLIGSEVGNVHHRVEIELAQHFACILVYLVASEKKRFLERNRKEEKRHVIGKDIHRKNSEEIR